MKKKIAALLSALLVSCSSTHHISGEKFESLYQHSKANFTMQKYEYLGEKNGKVYLRIATMSLLNKKQWNEDVYVADWDSLSAEFKDELLKKNTQKIKLRREYITPNSESERAK